MMENIHTVMLQKAAMLSDTRYGDYILKNTYWLERKTAGTFNDGVLKDWLYPSLPRSIWPLRELTKRILTTQKEDTLKVSFLLHWASHYLTDPIWVNHLATKYFINSFDEFVRFDNGIEREMEDRASEFIDQEVRLWNRGYWTSFWYVYSLMRQKVKAHVRQWRDKKDYLKVPTVNIGFCIRVLESYLRYLEILPRIDVSEFKPSKRFPQRIYCSVRDFKENLISLVIDISLSSRIRIEDVFTDSVEKADILIIDSAGGEYGAPSISTEENKIIITGDLKTIGAVVDAYLDLTEARFGTRSKEEVLQQWPGNYLLGKDWNGEELKENIYSEKFFKELAKIRGYQNLEILLNPERASSEAQEDRKRREREEKEWLSKWRRVSRNLSHIFGNIDI